MKAEHFIENNYHSKAGLEADKLIEDKTGKEVSFEEIAEAYHEHKLKLLGIANAVDSKPELKGVRSSFSIIVWNKKKDRPATNSEIDFLINGDDDNGQLFLAWNKVIVTKEDKGQIHLHIDSGEEDNYEIRYVV